MPDKDLIDITPYLLARFDEDTQKALDEVAWKRKLLERHKTVEPGRYTPYPYCECQCEDGVVYEVEPCETKRLMAQPYADRADFRQEWVIG